MTKITIYRAIVEQALEALERYQVKRQDFDRFADEITALRAALADHSDGVTNMVTTEPVNLLRLGLAHALRGIADGFDARRPWYRPWSRPDPLIMRTLRRAADELDKEDA
jgi:hypothetical protein